MAFDPDSENRKVKDEAVIRHERQVITAHLLDVYYTFKSELDAPEMTGAFPKEEDTIAREMVRNFLASFALPVDVFDDDLNRWAREELKQHEARLKAGVQLTREDVAGVIAFIETFLASLYAGKNIEEIQEKLEHENEEAAEQEDTFNLMDIPPGQRTEIIHDRAVELYKARYDWGYYPEVTRNLKVGKASLKSAIDERRKQLGDIHFNSNYNKDRNLDFLFQKIRSGKASEEETELYGLWRNKITAQWIGIVEADIQILCSLGSKFQAIYGELVELAERNGRYREEMAQYARETRATAGFIPFGDKRLADAMRHDIQRTDKLIEKALMILYPETAKNGKLNRGLLEHILHLNDRAYPL